MGKKLGKKTKQNRMAWIPIMRPAYKYRENISMYYIAGFVMYALLDNILQLIPLISVNTHLQ